MVRRFFGPTEVEPPEIEKVGPVREETLPPLLETMNAEYGDRARAAGATEFEARCAAIRRSLSRWESSGQMLGGRFSADAICAGCFLKSSDGKITYAHEQRAARDPEDFKRRHGHYPQVSKTVRGGAPTVVIVNVGEQRGGAGRARGRYGWSDDRDLISGALASFRHNFIAALVGYFERPGLPATKEWELPNLVLAETRIPNQFVPEASYTFRTRPSLRTVYVVKVNSPTDCTIGFDIWGTDKQTVLAKPVECNVPKGESIIRLGAMGSPCVGFFNINPISAPKGITVVEVKTIPISF